MFREFGIYPSLLKLLQRNFLGIEEVTFGGLLVLLVKNNRELPTTNFPSSLSIS